MFEPTEIWVTESAAHLWMTRRILGRVSLSCHSQVRSFVSHEAAIAAARLLPRSQQKQVLILAARPDRWIRRESFSGLCGRREAFVITLCRGCPFDCTYCYLQVRDEVACPTLFTDVDSLLGELTQAANAGLLSPHAMLNAAEDGELIETEWMSDFAFLLMEEVPRHLGWSLELRTKSSDVTSIAEAAHQGRTVLGFSINSADAADQFERRAHSVGQRLAAGRTCQENGLPIAIKLEPVLPVPGWRSAYGQLIEEACETLRPDMVHHFSLGTLRFRQSLHTRALENHGASAEALFAAGIEEVAHDRFSYPASLRIVMYEFIRSRLARCFPTVPVYLSLETSVMCQHLRMLSEQPSLKIAVATSHDL